MKAKPKFLFTFVRPDDSTIEESEAERLFAEICKAVFSGKGDTSNGNTVECTVDRKLYEQVMKEISIQNPDYRIIVDVDTIDENGSLDLYRMFFFNGVHNSRKVPQQGMSDKWMFKRRDEFSPPI